MLSQDIEQRAALYEALSSYYAGNIPSGETLIRLANAYLQTDLVLPPREDHVIFDFNRLFVGPQKLLAPPYESAYLSPDRMTMTRQTMSVRQAYRSVGIEIADKGRIPDDHLHYETAFAACLLRSLSQSPQTSGPDIAAHYAAFMRDHLLCWTFPHLEHVAAHSTTPFCRQVGKAAQLFFTSEKEALS